MYEKSTAPAPETTRAPLPEGQVDCTVQLWSVKDGSGYRSVVQFFLYQDPSRPTTEDPLPGEADGKVLLGWSVPLGDQTFPTREALRLAYATTPKGVPWTGLWVESAEAFLRRDPHAEALPAGVALGQDFARAHGLSTVVPRQDNPNVYDEAPVA